MDYDPWQSHTTNRSPAALVRKLEDLGLCIRWVIDETAGRAECMAWGDILRIDRSVNLLLVQAASMDGISLPAIRGDAAGRWRPVRAIWTM